SDGEWQRLVELMGRPAWATEPRFATVAGRLEHQDALDEGLESWTRTLGKYDVMERCQTAGVCAMPVQSAEDRVENDPQLAHRGMYQPLEHAALGTYKAQNAPFVLSGTPAFNHRASPMIGEHTAEVLEGLLGLSREEVRAGIRDGTLWPEKRPRFAYMEEVLG
ncbi:MAG: CoA transferase, partial [Hyphomicrobiaceae bacterium]